MGLYIYIIQEESILMGNNLDFAINGNKTRNCIKFILNDLSHYKQSHAIFYFILYNLPLHVKFLFKILRKNELLVHVGQVYMGKYV
jgi:hypothetical protein